MLSLWHLFIAPAGRHSETCAYENLVIFTYLEEAFQAEFHEVMFASGELVEVREIAGEEGKNDTPRLMDRHPDPD